MKNHMLDIKKERKELALRYVHLASLGELGIEEAKELEFILERSYEDSLLGLMIFQIDTAIDGSDSSVEEEIDDNNDSTDNTNNQVICTRWDDMPSNGDNKLQLYDWQPSDDHVAILGSLREVVILYSCGDSEGNSISGDTDKIFDGGCDEIIQVGDGGGFMYERAITGNDQIWADAGNTLRGYYGNDTSYGDIGNDVLDGEAGHDSLYGGSGDDTLYGEAGDDVLYDWTGNDCMEADHDSLHGGSGCDTIFGDSGDACINIPESDGDGTLISIKGLEATRYADRLVDDELDNRISGLGDDDVIDGRTGGDIFTGGAGRDRITEDNGNDYIEGDGGNDAIAGGNGDDIHDEYLDEDDLSEGTGDDVLHGGDGLTGGSEHDLTIIRRGDGETANFLIFEDEELTADNTLLTQVGENRLISIREVVNVKIVLYNFFAREGLDIFSGDSGNSGQDAVASDEGDDIIVGGSNDYTLNGYEGNKIIRGNSSLGIIDVRTPAALGAAGNDLIDGSGNDNLDRSGGDDVLDCGFGNDSELLLYRDDELLRMVIHAKERLTDLNLTHWTLTGISTLAINIAVQNMLLDAYTNNRQSSFHESLLEKLRPGPDVCWLTASTGAGKTSAVLASAVLGLRYGSDVCWLTTQIILGTDVTNSILNYVNPCGGMNKIESHDKLTSGITINYTNPQKSVNLSTIDEDILMVLLTNHDTLSKARHWKQLKEELQRFQAAYSTSIVELADGLGISEQSLYRFLDEPSSGLNGLTLSSEWKYLTESNHLYSAYDYDSLRRRENNSKNHAGDDRNPLHSYLDGEANYASHEEDRFDSSDTGENGGIDKSVFTKKGDDKPDKHSEGDILGIRTEQYVFSFLKLYLANSIMLYTIKSLTTLLQTFKQTSEPQHIELGLRYYYLSTLYALSDGDVDELQEILDIAQDDSNLNLLIAEIDDLAFERDVLQNPEEKDRFLVQKAKAEKMIFC